MGRPRRTGVTSQELFWLLAYQRGFFATEIGRAFEVPESTVRAGIARARRAGIPDLEILMPRDFVPGAPCEHDPIQVGDLVYCTQCHQTGIDGHPLLVRDPRTDPSRDRKPRPKPKPAPGKKTRKQRRSRDQKPAAGS